MCSLIFNPTSMRDGNPCCHAYYPARDGVDLVVGIANGEGKFSAVNNNRWEWGCSTGRHSSSRYAAAEDVEFAKLQCTHIRIPGKPAAPTYAQTIRGKSRAVFPDTCHRRFNLCTCNEAVF